MAKQSSARKRFKPVAKKTRDASSIVDNKSSTRRKFLKMAGAVTAAMLMQQQAKGLAVIPQFDSKWLAAIRLEEVGLSTGYNCSCYTESPYADDPYNCSAQAEDQYQTEWCVMGVVIGIVDFYLRRYPAGNDANWMSVGQCGLYNVVKNYTTTNVANCCDYGYRRATDDTLPCNKGCSTHDALFIVCHDNGDLPGWLCFDDIVANIYNDRPIVIGLTVHTGIVSGYSHAQIISGYGKDYSSYPWQGTVDISDPMTGEHPGVIYCEIESVFRATWESTFLTKPSTC